MMAMLIKESTPKSAKEELLLISLIESPVSVAKAEITMSASSSACGSVKLSDIEGGVGGSVDTELLLLESYLFSGLPFTVLIEPKALG
jgi:hypothetical protein